MVLPFHSDPANWVEVRDPAERSDVSAFCAHVVRMDEAAALRIVARGGAVRLWAQTPFGALVTRLVVGTASAEDQVVLAHAVADAASATTTPDPATTTDTADAAGTGRIDLGYLMPSAWQGMLPPATGFVQREILDAGEVLDLSRRGREVATAESGPAGVAPSLLEQPVISVAADAERGQPAADVPMRMLFALTGAGFVPTRDGTAPRGERVRLSTRGPWLRLDARFGSVYWRPEALPLSVS